MLFSIITVCFNSEKTIKDTIESVLSQRSVQFEYIIIDGLSNDTTVDIIKTYSVKYPDKISYLSEPDAGIYDAINKAIKKAKGDIIGILNSDDYYIHDQVLSKIESTFFLEKKQVVFADVRFVHSDNLGKTVRYYSSANFSPWKFKFGFMPAHPTFFTYRSNYQKYGLYKTDYKIAADYELLTRFLYANKLSYSYLPEAIIKMRLGGVSTRSIKSNYILNKEIVRACAENGIKTNIFLLGLKYFIKIKEFLVTRND
jgi:glycosyltransferase involved in cell wall biosynthesis